MVGGATFNDRVAKRSVLQLVAFSGNRAKLAKVVRAKMAKVVRAKMAKVVRAKTAKVISPKGWLRSRAAVIGGVHTSDCRKKKKV